MKKYLKMCITSVKHCIAVRIGWVSSRDLNDGGSVQSVMLVVMVSVGSEFQWVVGAAREKALAPPLPRPPSV